MGKMAKIPGVRRMKIANKAKKADKIYCGCYLFVTFGICGMAVSY
jgi:hypothetical protein